MDLPVKIGDYTLISYVGKGAFAIVYKAVHNITKREVAIKVIKKELFPKDKYEKEISILEKLDHPFVVAYYDTFENEENYYIVMEYVQLGSVIKLVKEKGALPNWLCKHFFCQMISVLDYLHATLRLAHRDFKLDNILIDRHYNIRVIDFGLGNEFKGNSAVLQTACGSPHYAPPEMMRGLPYTSAADIWSAGICLYVMAVGKLPLEDTSLVRLANKIKHEEPLYPETIDSELLCLIQALLSKNQEQRPEIAHIRSFPWFNSYYLSSKMKSDFGADKGWRNHWANEFVPDKAVLFDLQRVQNINILVDLMKNNVHNPETSLYRILKREKITHEMTGMNELAEHLVNTKPAPQPSLGANEQTKNVFKLMKNRRFHSYQDGSNSYRRRIAVSEDNAVIKNLLLSPTVNTNSDLQEDMIIKSPPVAPIPVNKSTVARPILSRTQQIKYNTGKLLSKRGSD